MKILLLDDDKILGQIPFKTLTKMGYEVVFVHNSMDAITALEAEIPPDICFFDIKLETEEKTGIDVAMIALRKSIQVILFTSYAKDSIFAKQAFDAGIPTRFFIDRNQMENEVYLDKIIEDAVLTYKLPVSQFEYLNYASRKIGIRPYRAGVEQYRFIGKDDIVFIESDPAGTGRTLIHTPEGEGNEIHVGCAVGLVAGQIRRVFCNIIRIDQSFCVNLEKITLLEGNTLHFTNGEHINLSKTGKQTLQKNNLIINCQH